MLYARIAAPRNVLPLMRQAIPLKYRTFITEFVQ